MAKSTAYIKMNFNDDFGNCEKAIDKMIAWVFCRAEQGADEDEALAKMRKLSTKAKRNGYQILGETLIVGDVCRAQQFVCGVAGRFVYADCIITNTINSIADGYENAFDMVDFLKALDMKLIVPMFGQLRVIENSVAILGAMQTGEIVDQHARVF